MCKSLQKLAEDKAEFSISRTSKDIWIKSEEKNFNSYQFMSLALLL